mmetsp:Transcript_18858/g.38099  ORF Transcript_18858/g.38099 Transcript_18858/m.38099 type:complete len:119 (-) Transcript_18858:106-462(-)
MCSAFVGDDNEENHQNHHHPYPDQVVVQLPFGASAYIPRAALMKEEALSGWAGAGRGRGAPGGATVSPQSEPGGDEALERKGRESGDEKQPTNKTRKMLSLDVDDEEEDNHHFLDRLD